MSLSVARRRLSSIRFSSTHSKSEKADIKWKKIIRKAEDVAGCSFGNVESLFNSEILEETGRHIPTDHPLPSRNLTESGDISFGLVVLLFAKAAQRGSPSPELEGLLCPITGVLPSQYIVSKVTELLKLSFRIHENVSASRDMNATKRMTILSGDYVLSECLRELAVLQDHFILDYMASGFRDLIFSRHVGSTDQLGNGPIPSQFRPENTSASCLDEFSCDPILFPNAFGDARAEWSFRATLGGGSLLAKSCLSCLRLARRPEYTQNIGFSFGKNFALALRAHRDLEEFSAGNGGRFDLVGAPFLFQLQDDRELYREIAEDAERVDFDFLRAAVMRGPGLERTATLRREHLKCARDALDIIGESRAQVALKNMLEAMAEEDS